MRPSHVWSTGFSRNDSSITLPPEGGTPNIFDNAQESTPDKLRRRLQGDLDNIILKALRKEPEHRYSSVEQFSEDIANHLIGKPVIARTPTVAYRVNKFVRRNKLGVAFASFAALTLIAIVGFVIWQRQAALAQARETRRDLYAARMDKVLQERDSFDLTGIRETVESFLPRAGEEDLRGFEWYYLWRWCNRDLLTFPHDRAIEGANVIENSSLVITSAPMGSYWMQNVWDTETGKLLRALTQKRGSANPDLFFLSGGVALQQVGKQSFRVWQLSTSKEVTPAIDSLSPIVSSVCDCADSLDYRGCQLFTAGEDGIIRGWDIATGALLCTFNTTTPITLQNLSLKYQRLALNVGSNRLEFWDTATQRRIRAIDGLAATPFADLEAFPSWPSGGGLLCMGDGVLKRFDWLTGRELQQIKIDENFRQILSTPGGKFFNLGGSSEVQIMDLLTGRHMGELKGHTGWVRFADLNPQETLAVTASADHTVRFWDFQTQRQLAVIPAHEREVYQARFFRDGSRLITVGADRTAKIWDVASLLAPDTLEGHSDYIFSVAFSPDSRTLASAGRDRTIKLWDVQTGKPLNTLNGHKLDIFKIAFSPTRNRLASANEDKTVRIWDVNAGKQVAELNDFDTRPRAVAFSPDGKLLAVGCDYWDFAHKVDDHRTIRIWDVATWREVMTIKGHQGDVVAIDFSPDGKRLASASWDNTARVWDVASGQELLQFTGHKEHVWSVRFSPDGRRIATGSADQTIRIWDAATGKELLPPLKGHSRDIFDLAFSPDGKRLASGSADGTVKLWDAATGRELVTFKDHNNEVWSVVFSPDGRTLATGSWDKTIRLYRAATEQEVQAKLSVQSSAKK
ncbi:MAG: hypothetical protein JST85_07690 [Acidobacteria bacterium]|nr:hypothetical protein [Acidobacteriota bacterium]